MRGDVEIVDPQLDGGRLGGTFVPDERNSGLEVGEFMLERRTGALHGPMISLYARNAEDPLASKHVWAIAARRASEHHRNQPT